MITRKYIIRGKVQGVGYRHFTLNVAEAFDVRGYVRNREDGAVEVLAGGTVTSLNSFREQLEIGPGSSRVDRIETEDIEGEDIPARFSIVG